MNATELEAMKNIDIITVDPSTLVDIQTVKINTELPTEERIADYIKQVKNPYCYKCGDTVIKSNFPVIGQRLAGIVINMITRK
jgi:hypothetical protein